VRIGQWSCLQEVQKNYPTTNKVLSQIQREDSQKRQGKVTDLFSQKTLAKAFDVKENLKNE